MLVPRDSDPMPNHPRPAPCDSDPALPDHPLLLHLFLYIISALRLLHLHSAKESVMKFGKYFRYQLEETLPTWRDKYLDYKALKRLIRRLPPPQQGDAPPSLPAPVAAEGEEGDGQVVGQGNVVCFARFLDMELDKLDEFYMDREEWNIIRLQVRFDLYSSPRGPVVT